VPWTSLPNPEILGDFFEIRATDRLRTLSIYFIFWNITPQKADIVSLQQTLAEKSRRIEASCLLSRRRLVELIPSSCKHFTSVRTRPFQVPSNGPCPSVSDPEHTSGLRPHCVVSSQLSCMLPLSHHKLRDLFKGFACLSIIYTSVSRYRAATHLEPSLILEEPNFLVLFVGCKQVSMPGK
jgi:hypothetical protein